MIYTAASGCSDPTCQATHRPDSYFSCLRLCECVYVCVYVCMCMCVRFCLQLNSSQRSEIVKSAAKVLDSKDSKLVAKLGSLILRITKGGANLLSVSKLLFKLSKTPSNDVIFLQEVSCNCHSCPIRFASLHASRWPLPYRASRCT